MDTPWRSGMALMVLLDGGKKKGTELGMKNIRAGPVGAGMVAVSVCPC